MFPPKNPYPSHNIVVFNYLSSEFNFDDPYILSHEFHHGSE